MRPERYDLNQFKGMSVIPVEASLSRRLFWDTVLKAALRSGRVRMFNGPKSTTMQRSLVIFFTKAVSVP